MVGCPFSGEGDFTRLNQTPPRMLRQAARSLLAASKRGISTSAVQLEEVSVPAGTKEFAESWMKKAPQNLELPEFPSNFMKMGGTGDSLAQGDLFPVNLYTPHGVLCDGGKVGGLIVELVRLVM